MRLFEYMTKLAFLTRPAIIAALFPAVIRKQRQPFFTPECSVSAFRFLLSVLSKVFRFPLSVLPLALCVALMGPTAASAAIGTPVSVGSTTFRTSGTGVSSVTVSPVTVAAGNTIIVTVAMNENGSTVTATDSAGNTYNRDADITNPNGNGDRALVFSFEMTTALSAGPVTVSSTIATRAYSVSCLSVSGITSPADKTHTGSGDSGSASSGATTTTSQANELLIGAAGWGNSADGSPTLAQMSAGRRLHFGGGCPDHLVMPFSPNMKSSSSTGNIYGY